MASPRNHDALPPVTEDDFFAMLFQSDEARWQEFSEEQSTLAQQIELRANRLRLDLQGGKISPLEAEQRAIDLAVFVASAIRHAVATRRQEQPVEPNPPVDPPLSA